MGALFANLSLLLLDRLNQHGHETRIINGLRIETVFFKGHLFRHHLADVFRVLAKPAQTHAGRLADALCTRPRSEWEANMPVFAVGVFAHVGSVEIPEPLGQV